MIPDQGRGKICIVGAILCILFKKPLWKFNFSFRRKFNHMSQPTLKLFQCPFLVIFVQKLFFIQKTVNLSSKSLLDLTKQVSTCFEYFMNISWFYLIKVNFSGHFWPYTLSVPSCTWFLMIGMLVGLKLFIISWVWLHICAPVKFLTFFPTWASNRNLIFQAKLQNSLCSCTSWGIQWNLWYITWKLLI